MIELIQQILNSNLTHYEISKNSGVNASIISNLRSGKREIDNISLKNAIKFENYYKGEFKMKNQTKKIEEVTAWLKEFGTVEQYSATKKEPKTIENAQPLNFVSFYYSTLEDERENTEFEGSYEALAEILNLSEIKPDETFIQLLPEDFEDSTNATAFYLSEVTGKEKLMEFVNDALDMDQVTHSSGLKSRYQFI